MGRGPSDFFLCMSVFLVKFRIIDDELKVID